MIHTGEFAAAQNHFTHSLTLYDAQGGNPQALAAAQDPGVHCRSYLAEILWWRGYPDQARQSCQEALAQARRLSHPQSRAVTLASAAILHNWLREHQVAQGFSQELIALATEQGFPHWLAVGMLRHGWTLAEQGKSAAGMAQMREGLAVFQSTGAKLSLSVFLCELAWAYGRAGQRDKGLALLAEAQTLIAKTGERLYEVELYRLYGELTLQIDEPENRRVGETERKKERASVPDSPLLRFSVSSPEEAFLKAISIAQQQQAKSLELRAVMSLVRLRQQQALEHGAGSTEQGAPNRLAEAHRMLSDLYGWFTEGFDTADLQEAKTLLESLSVG